MSHILVIEDQEKLRRNLQQILEHEGYDVVATASGEEGFVLATTGPCDAVILDLTLPHRDGGQLLSDLRSHGFSKPVLILTARDSISDRVNGLDRGADDYMVKPFAHVELLARLRALLRRGGPAQEVLLRSSMINFDPKATWPK